ncbi:Putative nuclear matrix constituent protein 1-like protein [Apostasia shenzhenica]|uniref:Nuclear matrix constituent protein 1-like protein n=1 Tax=Apostasia shenzhenica TaxID=1088818 RepID=A0A2I0BDU5_9ASPA|nr:Putative nuclear matrix constituent protein 1-like protein [Apostasia shenzhenica]
MSSPGRAATPASVGGLRPAGSRDSAAATPLAANGKSPLEEEAIWRRLREAGFDEDKVKRRDKAALIAYVTRLEAEIYDYQCNMGLILLEKKDLESKYEEVKSSLKLAENMHKRDQAANHSALAEGRRREESLKKALGIEKECLANIEKALHETRAESAEIKVSYERKLAEAKSMMESAQKQYDEAISKIHDAESLHAEVSRRDNTALRKLQDVEAREDELRRRISTFHYECETKEKALNLQRQSLSDSQKILHQEQEKLMEGQSLLNQREEFLYRRLKELEEGRLKVDEDCRTLREEKEYLEMDRSAVATREEAVVKMEALLDKKERDLLILQEKICSKEVEEIQRLKGEHQSFIDRKTYEFEAEMEQRRKFVEAEMEVKVRACDLRVAELEQKEKELMEREISVQIELRVISDKHEDIVKRFQFLEEKEKSLHTAESALELKMKSMQTETVAIKKMQEELLKAKALLKQEKNEILCAEEKLVLTANERNDLRVLERKLKEEIDSFRAQKMELDAEADKLKLEKEKFEIEWDLIDEKREELRKEADRIAEEKSAINIYLKNEIDSLNLEKENLRNQLKQNAESLSREREEFLRRMEHEHSDWFFKLQKEREDFLNDCSIQRKELEESIHRRQEEIENYLREKEQAFEHEKNKELQGIASQKEEATKMLERVASELKRLVNERMSIAHEREQRQMEWSEIKQFIKELNVQREKLQKQRELLHVDREEVHKQIEQLQKLEHLDIELENRSLYENDTVHLRLRNGNVPERNKLDVRVATNNSDYLDSQKISLADGIKPNSSKKALPHASPPSMPMTWIRKCAEVIFKRSPERYADVAAQEDKSSQLSTSLLHWHENDEGAHGLGRKRNREKNVYQSKEDAFIAKGKENGRSEHASPVMLPLQRKRSIDALSNDRPGLELGDEQKHLKKVRQEAFVEMAECLECRDPSEMVSHASEDLIVLEAAESPVMITTAENGGEIKEQIGCHDEVEDTEEAHPSIGAKIKNFLIT